MSQAMNLRQQFRETNSSESLDKNLSAFWESFTSLLKVWSSATVGSWHVSDVIGTVCGSFTDATASSEKTEQQLAN